MALLREVVTLLVHLNMIALSLHFHKISADGRGFTAIKFQTLNSVHPIALYYWD